MALQKLLPGQKYKPYPHRFPVGCQALGQHDTVPGSPKAMHEGDHLDAVVASLEPPVLDEGMDPSQSQKVAKWLKALPSVVLHEALKILGM